MDKILVTGATGQLGSAMVGALVGKGKHVRAATRKTTKIRWTDMVQPVAFDFEDAGLHKAALDGMSGLFLVAPPLDFEAPAKLIPFIDKAKQMRVEHIVFISAFGMDANAQAPLRIIERYLMNSGLAYTILRPNFFMENFSTGFVAPMIAGGRIYMAAGDGKTSFISVSDIAEAAATAFEKKHYGAEYNLTGPEALSYGQVAEIISALCGRTVTYHPISETEMAKGARDKGMPESAIRYLADLFSAVRNGLMATITDGVRKVIERDAVSFSEFAQMSTAFCKQSKAA